MQRYFAIIFSLLCFLPACAHHGAKVKKPLSAAYAPLTRQKLPIYESDMAPSSAEMRLVINPKGSPPVRLKGFMLLSQPASFRLEVDGAIGSGTAITCNGLKLSVLNSYERTFNEYPAADISLAAILPVPLSCQDVLAILHGELPSGIKDIKISYDSQAGLIGATFKHRGYYWHATFLPLENPPAQLNSLELRVNRRSDPLVVIELSDYKEFSGQKRPGKWFFNARQEGLKTILKLDDYESALPTPNLFELKRPNGYQ